MQQPHAMYAFFNLGTGEILLILLVVLLLFGAKRLPELARGLGKGINAVSYTHLTLPTSDLV